MPLCYGGRIGTFDDARTLFGLGVEKVAIQSAFVNDPIILRLIADHAGEQAVVASIDIEKNWLGRQRVRTASRVKAATGRLVKPSATGCVQWGR